MKIILILLISIFCIVLSALNVQGLITDSLYAYYNFSNGSLASFNSTAPTGTNNGATNFSSGDIVDNNGFFSCDGDDFIDFGVDSKLSLGDMNFTLGFWVNHTIAGVETIMLGTDELANRGVLLYADLGENDGKLKLVDEDTGFAFRTTSAAFDDGAWIYIMFTYNHTTKNATSYMNGTRDNSAITTPFFSNSTANTYLCGSERTGGTFTGDFDEVAMWTRVLSGQEAIGVYNNYTLGKRPTDALQAPADTTSPIVNTSFNITSPVVNDVINFSGNITDGVGLATANITYNISGVLTKVNFTLSGTSARIHNVTTLTCIETCVVNFTMYATDTSNNVRQNSTLISIPDITRPVVNTSFNVTSPVVNDVINFSGNITDGVGLLTVNITYNMSGTITYVNYTISGTSAQIHNITTITTGAGSVINFTMYATDTSNNVRQNSTLITIVDLAFPSINFSLNISSLPQNTVVNMSVNASDDIQLSFCQLIVNSTGTNRYFNFTLSGTGDKCSQNVTISQSNGVVVNFTVRVNDTSNNFNQSSLLFTIGDLTAPVLNNCTLQFSTLTDASGNTNTLNCTATDASSNIQSMSFDLNGSLNVTRSFSFSQAQTISVSYVIFESLETLKVGSYSIKNVTVTDTSNNKLVNSTIFDFTVTSAPVGGSGGSSGGGDGGGSIQPQPQCKENELLVSNKCVNASLFNVTLKVVGLTNIQPIVFYRTCGSFQEWRHLLRLNKIIKNASFEKSQVNTQIKIMDSTVLIAKQLKPVGFSQRIDMGKLRIIDATGQVVFVDIGLKIINMCNYPIWVILASIPMILIFRKKLMKLLKIKGKI